MPAWRFRASCDGFAPLYYMVHTSDSGALTPAFSALAAAPLPVLLTGASAVRMKRNAAARRTAQGEDGIDRLRAWRTSTISEAARHRSGGRSERERESGESAATLSLPSPLPSPALPGPTKRLPGLRAASRALPWRPMASAMRCAAIWPCDRALGRRRAAWQGAACPLEGWAVGVRAGKGWDGSLSHAPAWSGSHLARRGGSHPVWVPCPPVVAAHGSWRSWRSWRTWPSQPGAPTREARPP